MADETHTDVSISNPSTTLDGNTLILLSQKISSNPNVYKDVVIRAADLKTWLNS